MINPTEWEPLRIDDLIGEARRVGRIVTAKIQRLQKSPKAVFKQLYFGPPGTGKSSLARLVAETLCPEPFNLERKAGQDVNVELVREWERDLFLPSLFGGWRVKLVNEIDLMPPASQSRLLDYLDLLPPQHAFVGTSNVNLTELQERFQTRLQPWKIEGPTTEQIIEFIMQHWPVSITAARAIAVGSGGNVRAACLDTESELDVLMSQEAA